MRKWAENFGEKDLGRRNLFRGDIHTSAWHIRSTAHRRCVKEICKRKPSGETGDRAISRISRGAQVSKLSPADGYRPTRLRSKRGLCRGRPREARERNRETSAPPVRCVRAPGDYQAIWKLPAHHRQRTAARHQSLPSRQHKTEPLPTLVRGSSGPWRVLAWPRQASRARV